MSTRTRHPAVAVLAMLALSLTVPSAAVGAPARASLMDVENSLMCVVCDEPLSVAQSPEAYQERDFVRGLIAKGDTKSQIMAAMVVQYGVAVLGKPPAHGFNLTVYVLPPAVLVAGVALLAFTLPRWRRRVRAQAAQDRAGPTLTAGEQQRLQDELSHFPG